MKYELHHARRFRSRPLTLAVLAMLAAIRVVAGEPVLKSIRLDKKSPIADAVVVKQADLIHTAQLLPVGKDGKLVSPEPSPQVDAVFNQLDTLLALSRSKSEQVVKINVYAKDESIVALVRARLGAMYRDEHRPAVAFVATRLPVEGAVVAIDAVAARPAGEEPAIEVIQTNAVPGDARFAQATVLPPGDVVYVSGQAENGTLAEATRLTLGTLKRTLEELELGLSEVIALKTFLTPMSEIRVVEEEFARFFEGQKVPPVSHVEWSAGTPIEIELVAYAPFTSEGDTVSYLTPSFMNSSPVFSRVTRLHRDERIYVSGLLAKSKGNGEHQVKQLFQTLDKILVATGSDVKHLAKATYYVSDEDASSKLNEIRPGIYDAKRPPAASKAMVGGVGVADRTITMDMIAAPALGR